MGTSLKHAPARPARLPGARRPASRLALAALSLILAGAAVLAWWPRGAAPPAAPPAGIDAADVRELAELPLVAQRLRTRLEKAPGDGAGWALLARTYARLGEYGNAGAAFEKAAALQTGDASLLVDYADTLAFLNQRSFAGRPMALIEQALKLDPAHTGALMLAGLAAFDREDWDKAQAYWERARDAAGAGSPAARQAQEGIAEARRRAGR